MQYCADCTYMENASNKDGLFPCTNNKSGYKVVSARKAKCDCFLECFNSRRCESEREALMSISRDHGYYIVTAISKILNLGEDNEYLVNFQYFKDVILPRTFEGIVLVNQYDDIGPELASKLLSDPLREEYSLYLLSHYLDPLIHELHSENYMATVRNVDSTIRIFKDMLTEIKEHYSIKYERKIS